MAATTLIDVRLLTGGYEVTSDHNQGSLTRSREAVQKTVFGNTAHNYLPGLKSATYSLAGYFDSDGSAGINDIHQAQYAGSGSQVTTIVAPDGTAGSTAFSFQSITSDLMDFGGSIGDMAAFTVSGSGTGASFRGTLMEAGTSARSSSSNSSAYQLTDLVAGQTAYAALHVIATTGSPTLDVTIESDDGAGFGTPTTQLTFTQATAIGAEWQSSTSATADDYWRAAWTFGGTGDITFAVTFGIVTD